MKTVGVIGGSGLYEMEGLEQVERLRLSTPFGDPSDEFVVGQIGETRMVFLPRHGRGHRLLPTEVPYRANIYGMKKLGVEWLVSVASVGSLRAEIEPGHLVIPDQLIDRTFQRPSTFFGNGIVAHVAFADPFCPVLSRQLVASCDAVGAKVHAGGTYVCMEGPQFSTRAESRLHRSWDASIIGMTNLQEAKLAREAEICFATLALSTDYDCWHEAHQDVVIEDVLRIMNANVATARKVVGHAAPHLHGPRTCACASALESAIITDRAVIPAKTKRDLEPIVGKYLS